MSAPSNRAPQAGGAADEVVPPVGVSRVRLDGVRLTYDGGATWPLNGISLDVKDGERLCVLGPNGSGKSTLAQVICGLEAPDEGTVELAGRVAFSDGTPDADAYRAARHGTGLVFQNPEDQVVTSIVADDVAFGPENLGVPTEEIVRRVARELERVALADRAQDDPARLSGGQQQRVAIAGALAMRPDLLVLDEPGAMLDVIGRRGIMDVLAKLQEAGTTIVHITHFMDEALAADRVIVMLAGRVALEGTPEEVFSHASQLREMGLDVPQVTRTSLDLGLVACCSAEELAGELRRDARERNSARIGESRHAGVPSTQPSAPSTQPSAPSTQPSATDPILRVSHLGFRYGKRPVLENVSLEVAPGELVAVAGRTGSGKSTLARLVCALAKPSAGSIEVGGVPTTCRRRRRQLRGTVGYVMQRPERQLFAETVLDDVAFGPKNLGLTRDEALGRAREQLAFLGIEDKADASPFSLSGGQQRLAALAGVLAMEPALLVLDEPVAGLDPHATQQLKGIMRELLARGVAILLVSHSMEDIAELASRMVVLEAGHVALSGTPTEVFSHEGELSELGLGVPAPLALARRLERLGVASAHELGEPITSPELAAALARWLESQRQDRAEEDAVASEAPIARPSHAPADPPALRSPRALDARAGLSSHASANPAPHPSRSLAPEEVRPC